MLDSMSRKTFVSQKYKNNNSNTRHFLGVGKEIRHHFLWFISSQLIFTAFVGASPRKKLNPVKLVLYSNQV